jgi:phosphate transport system permease protein
MSRQQTSAWPWPDHRVAVLVFIPVVLVIVYLVASGIGAINWEFLTAMPRNGMKEGGIMPAILGTLILTFGTAIVSMPVSILAAIYLAEYAKDNRLTRTIRMAIVNLAGIPSIVYGLFGLGAFVLSWLWHVDRGRRADAGHHDHAGGDQHRRGGDHGRAAAVPHRQPQPGRHQVADHPHQVLPHALPGILTGVILGLSRAAGETAPILFTVAAFYLPTLPSSVFDQTMALPYHLYVISTQVPGMPLSIQYGTALVLLLITLTLTLLATGVRTTVRRRRDW